MTGLGDTGDDEAQCTWAIWFLISVCALVKLELQSGNVHMALHCELSQDSSRYAQELGIGDGEALWEELRVYEKRYWKSCPKTTLWRAIKKCVTPLCLLMDYQEPSRYQSWHIVEPRKGGSGGKVAAAETGRHAEDPHHPCKKPGVAACGSNTSAGQQRPEDPQVCHGSISLDSWCAPGPERDSLQAVR